MDGWIAQQVCVNDYQIVKLSEAEAFLQAAMPAQPGNEQRENSG